MKRNLLIVLAVVFGTVFNIKAQSIAQMQKDLLSLYENGGLSVMLVSEPNNDEPFFTFKVGENHEDHFATLDWFHVYTKPNYAIKSYSIITDSDVSLSEWRESKGLKPDKKDRYIQLAGWTSIPDISLPEIKTATVKGDYVNTVNRDIHELYDGYITEEYKTMKGKEGGHGPSASYSAFLNHTVLSVVIEYDGAGFNTPNARYKTFNIDVATGQKVSNTELISLSGLTTRDVENVIQAANSHKIKFSEGTIACRSLDEIPMYLSKGELMLCVKVENLPYGDGTYIKLLNVNRWLPEQSSISEGKNSINGFAALSDGTGSRILLPAANIDENTARRFTHAIYQSVAYPVKYIGRQNGGEEFYQMEGYLYENLKKEFKLYEPINGSVFLCDNATLQNNELIQTWIVNEEPGDRTLQRVEKDYNKKVGSAVILYSFGKMGKDALCNMVFNKEGNEFLSIYSFHHDNEIAYLEFPQHKQQDFDIWGTDDNGDPILMTHNLSATFKTPSGYAFIMNIDEGDAIKNYCLKQEGKKLIPYAINTIHYPDALSQQEQSGTSSSSTGQAFSFAQIQSLQTVSPDNTNINPTGIFKKHANPIEGFTVEEKGGRVFISFEPGKMLKFWNRTDLSGKLKSTPYEVKGLKGKCTGVFVGDIGQDYNPTLCMLMEDGSVEMLTIIEAIFTADGAFDFTSSGPLPGFDNISYFHFGGGGEYEEDGEIRYSYVTIYAVDKNDEEYEIEPSYLGFGFLEYRSTENNEIHTVDFTDDWKINYTIKDAQGTILKQYKGYFREISHNDNYNTFVLSYQFTSPTAVNGSMSVKIEGNNVQTITPIKGLEFGGHLGKGIAYHQSF